MEKLFQCVEKVQKNNDECSFKDIIDKFSPKIKKYLSQTQRQSRDDLKQNLNITLYKKVKSYPLDEVPGFDEFEEKKLKT